MQGNGSVTVESNVFTGLPVSWASRVNREQGKTSPEELLAAAHAACFAMAFSNTLSKAGHDPEQLNVSATCTFEQAGEGFKVSRMVLDVTGRVSGLSTDEFSSIASQAEQGCPISNALRGNLDITVNARLEG